MGNERSKRIEAAISEGKIVEHFPPGSQIYVVARDLALRVYGNELSRMPPVEFCWIFEDSGAFDVYVLQIIQSFLYEKWTRIVHWDSTKRRVGLDYTLEEVKQICENANCVKIIDSKNKDMWAISAPENTYAIENLRNGRPITHGRGLAKKDVLKYWEGPLAEAGGGKYFWYNKHDHEEHRFPHCVYWGCNNWEAIHIGNWTFGCQHKCDYGGNKSGNALEVYVILKSQKEEDIYE